MWNPLRNTRGYMAARRRLFGTITHVRTDEPVAALTFDDGPDPAFTPQLLELLEQYGARATFFVVGERAARHPELLQRMVDGGHLLGNHTWSHPALPLLSRSERLGEILRCQNALPTGQRARLFRPPFGYQDLHTRLDVLGLGYDVVGWNAAGDDCLGAEADTIAERLLREITPGSIVLMHDSLYKTLDNGFLDRRHMMDALSRVLARLTASYRFVTVAELLRLGEPERELWWRKPDVQMLARLVQSKASEQQPT
jgi:peptidoglycan-N-acetylglucosamine deacetylase